MGNKYSIPGEEIQKLLDNSAKKIDELNLQIDIYQRIMLEEMQNPTIMPKLTNNFEDRYSTYSTSMQTEFNFFIHITIIKYILYQLRITISFQYY